MARVSRPSAALPVPPPAPATVSPAEAERRARRLEPLAIGSIAAFGVLFLAVRARRTGPLDLGLTRLAQRVTPRPVERLLHGVSWPGFPPQSRLIPPALIAGWFAAGLPAEAACQAAGWGSAILSEAIKALVRRPRPIAPEVRVVVAPLAGTSFPSGHVLTYVGVYGTSAYLAAGRLRGGWRLLGLAPLALVVLVGPSRVQQGHHWPTDVAASYLLGSAWLAGVVALHRRLVWLEARGGDGA